LKVKFKVELKVTIRCPPTNPTTFVKVIFGLAAPLTRYSRGGFEIGGVYYSQLYYSPTTLPHMFPRFYLPSTQPTNPLIFLVPV